VFSSVGGNLDSAASCEFGEVFKRDLTGGEQTTLVSRPTGTGARSSLVNFTFDSGQRAVSADGTAADNFVEAGSISADGRHVAFLTTGTNLLPGVNGPGVFVRDLVTSELLLASRKDGPGGDPVDVNESGGAEPAIDADGTRVAFVSDADLVPEDANAKEDVYVRDLVAGTTTLASAGPNGVGNGRSTAPALSADGTRVAFQSSSTNLAGDPVSAGHIYVRDLTAGTTVLADRSSDGAPGTTEAFSPQISGDGNRVMFSTEHALTPDPLPAGTAGIYVPDLTAQTTTLASRADGPSGPATRARWSVQPGR
jgi:TolB protein